MAARLTARRFLSPLSQIQRPFIRTMATAPPSEYEFVLVIPDKPGPEVRAKRLQVRPQHFSDMTPTLKDGWLKMGGGILNEVPEDDNDPNTFDFAGSIMVLVAKSKEDAINKVKDDIYVRAGVWDLEKAQVYPFKKGFRFE
ncbi:YCII domain-containing protein [Trichoderma simmonsii]|uniref:YCII domain-containing protein n=1 Tax=Trichoderma simmonsii TaxID=1491479 RepID=A0A8G0L8I3_9HYPO|nr:YCII domain-containing protein [Trichoderma simmonsii]